MKHFGNAYGTLKVKKNGDDGSIYITVDSQGSFAGVGIENAPALALAILEAAGVKASHPTTRSTGTPARGSDAALEDVALMLQEHVAAKLRKALEAADREALEAEAFALYAGAPITNGIKSFAALSEGAQHQWLTIARTARELHKAVS